MKLRKKIKSWCHRLSRKKIERIKHKLGINDDLEGMIYRLGTCSCASKYATLRFYEGLLEDISNLEPDRQIVTNFSGINEQVSEEYVKLLTEVKKSHYPDNAHLYFSDEQRSE